MAARYLIPNPQIGQQFGRWTVLGDASPTHLGVRRSWCQCQCGTKRAIVIYALHYGTTSSCGCYTLERIRETKTKHGMSPRGKSIPEYTAWQNMKSRIFNRNCSDFHNYGGRGITMCKRWLKFQNFLADMGPRPSPSHSLDRKNNNGPYCRKNCRWATRKQQNSNMRRTRYITFQGKTQFAEQWAKEIGIDSSSFHYRLKHWPLEQAILLPKGSRLRNNC